MSLKDDIKIIFKLRPYESFTRNDLLLLLIDSVSYTHLTLPTILRV